MPLPKLLRRTWKRCLVAHCYIVVTICIGHTPILHQQKQVLLFDNSLWLLFFVVEPCESGEEETMETLVSPDSLLNMECADTLSLEHYCKHGCVHLEHAVS